MQISLSLSLSLWSVCVYYKIEASSVSMWFQFLNFHKNAHDRIFVKAHMTNSGIMHLARYNLFWKQPNEDRISLKA
jgi:hypothetical protein